MDIQADLSPSEELAAALADGSALLGTSLPTSGANHMEMVLESRLLAYYDRLQTPRPTLGTSSLEDLQMLTAREAVRVLRRVQTVLDSEMDAKNSASANQPPSIGTRDLAQLRTLLSLTFKWGAEPLLTRIIGMWPIATPRGPKIIDLTSDSEDYKHLSSLVLSIFSLVFPEGPEGRIGQTLITTTILTRHVPDLLLPSISLGWLPESFPSPSMPTLHEARPLVTRILRLLTPSQAIIALGGILSSPSPSLIHTRKACTFLLTKQLLRPEGVPGLCEAMFSGQETGSDDAKLENLEQIATTLNALPSSMKPQDYYPVILPRVFKLLINERRISYKRAAAFTIYRAIVPQKPTQHREYVSSLVLDMLQKPFLDIVDAPEEKTNFLAPHEALAALRNLMSNTEPSPAFVPKILSPIIPSLYLLSFDLDQIKTSDPQLKETVNGLLVSWGKIVDEVEGSKVLWSIVENGKQGEWKFNLEGHFWRTKSNTSSEKFSQFSLLLPEKEPQISDDNFDEDLNLFNIYPDPIHFVQLLRKVDRADISSSLFLKLLENYRDMKGRPGEDSMAILHKLQIIMQMQNRLAEGTTSNILRKPNHLLSFIFHVLDSANVSMLNEQNQGAAGYNSNSNEDALEDGDSDDEDPESEHVGPDDELIETAITLFLSILEADESLSARTYPILNDIFTKLELLALKGSSTLRPLAREARLVITARLADSSEFSSGKKRKNGGEDVQEIYQRALKLLQDPILPVRAHGLLLLRRLVGPEFSKDQQMNTALLPAILSIFLQSIQDEDSYIFLNAVQGLASLVDTYGKEILRRLIHDYTDGLDGLGAGNLSQQDIDIRTRIGEALGSVIKHCGMALGVYVDMLVPPLFAVVRASNVPTTIRTSSLSLLAECVDTYPLAMLPYVEDLCQALVHLLQIESQSLEASQFQPKITNEAAKDTKNPEDKSSPPTMDSDPMSKNSKLPPLRRAALRFFSLLIRATTKAVYENSNENASVFFSKEIFRGLGLTLGYISSTDTDDVVRVMAREAKENMEQLQRAVLGLE